MPDWHSELRKFLVTPLGAATADPSRTLKEIEKQVKRGKMRKGSYFGGLTAGFEEVA